MWESLTKLAASIVDFTKGAKKNREEIKELQKQVETLTWG